MRHILLIGILLIQINVIADPDRQPSIDSTKYFVINKDTLSVYNFWKKNRFDLTVIRSESKFSIKSEEWKGGEFFIELNEDRNKIILQEVANPWRPDQIILNQIESQTTNFKLDYVFELTKEEKTDVVENFHHLERIKYSPQLPKAFTERGLYMLATILKGEKATQTTLAIIDTFARIKHLSRNIKELSELRKYLKPLTERNNAQLVTNAKFQCCPAEQPR